jgi:hypothetical protein
MQSFRSLCALLLCLTSCGGGEVVAVRIKTVQNPNAATNPNGYYVCKPDQATSFNCASGRAFHQYHRRFEIGEPCQHGVASIYVETSDGKVSRIEYACGLPPVEDFPAVPAPSAAPSLPTAPTGP